MQVARAFRGVAASPTGGTTRLYLNTTDSAQDIAYNISDESKRVIVRLLADYNNSEGGNDLLPGSNLFHFSVMLNATHAVGTASDKAELNITIVNMTVTEPVSDNYATIGLSDLNGDGIDDIYWTGTLTAGVPTYIDFNATIVSGTNFDSTNMECDPGDSKSYFFESGNTRDNTFTGIGFREAEKLARGPVQEGIEMWQSDSWKIRGFIKNLATGLKYDLTSWDLYQVGTATPEASWTGEVVLNESTTTANQYYTGWQSAASGKAYYQIAFDWGIQWGTSVYSSETVSAMALPQLYQIDLTGSKTVSLKNTTNDTQVLEIRDDIQHIGHASVSINSIYWNSTLPYIGGSTRTNWTGLTAQLYYTNSTNTSLLTLLSYEPEVTNCSNADGLVKVEIDDLQSTIGRKLVQNDYLVLIYNISGNRSAQDSTYLFNSSVSGHTDSGTPRAINFLDSIFLALYSPPTPPVPGAPGPGAGAGAAPAAALIKRAIALTMDIESDQRDANVNLAATVAGGEGVQNFTFRLLLPMGAQLGEVEIKVHGRTFLMNASYGSMRRVMGENYMVYGFGTWDLNSGEKLVVNYPVRLKVGVNNLIAAVSAYDPSVKKTIEGSISKTVVVGPPPSLEGFQVTEGEFVIAQAEVGKSVRWHKTYFVYNNQSSREGVFRARVFPDMLGVNVLDSEGNHSAKLIKEGSNLYIEWSDRLYKFEGKTYVIEVFTPPVMEKVVRLDVINTSKELTYYKINFTLENTALEDYYNLTYHLPIEIGKVVSIRMDDGGKLSYRENPPAILIPAFAALGERRGALIYQERPPKLLILTDAELFPLNESLDFETVLISKDELEDVYMEIEIMGDEPSYETVYYDTLKMGDIGAATVTRTPHAVSVRSAPGTHTIQVKVRKSLWTILVARKEVELTGPGALVQLLSSVFLIFILIILSLLVYRMSRMSQFIPLLLQREKKCVVCGKDFKGEKAYRCTYCRKPVCMSHVKFHKGRLYCEKCVRIMRTQSPA